MLSSYSETNFYDVVICGAGLAGMTLALQLRNRMPGLSILVLERTSGELPRTTHKVGESMTEGGTYLLSQLAGLKNYIESTHIRKLGLRFFGAGYRKNGFEQRFEIGDTFFARNKTYQVDRGILESDLRRFCRDENIQFREEVTVKTVDFSAEQHSVSFLDTQADQLTTVNCHWVLDASGRRRLLQRKLGTAKKLEHNASATWWWLDGDFDVSKMVPAEKEDWHERVVPKRWLSTNQVFGPGYFIWFISLCSDTTSIGIVADETMHPVRERNTMEKSLAWLAENEPDLYNFMKDEKPLGFRMMKNFAYTTTQAFSTQRWACTGEAAAFTDPLYGMGTDFIGICNRVTTKMIELDMADSLTEEVAGLYNQLFLNVINVASRLFTNMYPTFKSDDVLILKIMWDIGCYWGYFSQLVIQDYLYQPSLLPKLLELLERLGDINSRVQDAFRYAADSNLQESRRSGYYNFGGVSELIDMRAKVNEKKTIQEFEEGIVFLEQFAASLIDFVPNLESGSTTKNKCSDEPAGLNPLIEKLSAYLTPSEQVTLLAGRG